MFRRILLIAVLLFCSFVLVSAQALPRAYETTNVAPVPGMLELNQPFNMLVGDADGVRRPHAAIIRSYVIWLQPVRPPEYWVELTDMNCNPACPWFILNRETIDVQRAP